MSCVAAVRRDGVVTPGNWILREEQHPVVELVREQITGVWGRRSRKQLSLQEIQHVEAVLRWVFTFGTAHPDDGLVKTIVRLKQLSRMSQVRDVFGDSAWVRVRLSISHIIAQREGIPQREVYWGADYKPLVEVCEYLVMLSSRPEDWVAEDGSHKLIPALP